MDNPISLHEFLKIESKGAVIRRALEMLQHEVDSYANALLTGKVPDADFNSTGMQKAAEYLYSHKELSIWSSLGTTTSILSRVHGISQCLISSAENACAHYRIFEPQRADEIHAFFSSLDKDAADIINSSTADAPKSGGTLAYSDRINAIVFAWAVILDNLTGDPSTLQPNMSKGKMRDPIRDGMPISALCRLSEHFHIPEKTFMAAKQRLSAINVAVPEGISVKVQSFLSELSPKFRHGKNPITTFMEALPRDLPLSIARILCPLLFAGESGERLHKLFRMHLSSKLYVKSPKILFSKALTESILLSVKETVIMPNIQNHAANIVVSEFVSSETGAKSARNMILEEFKPELSSRGGEFAGKDIIKLEFECNRFNVKRLAKIRDKLLALAVRKNEIASIMGA